jgi:predicted SPOUT superfamily RNA methylase MTH1
VQHGTACLLQVARCAAIFNVDELVVIDDSPQAAKRDGSVGAGAAFLARVAQYLETPQYLRKALIPMHSDLRLAGLLPPLDAPHHMRASEWKQYREGLVLKVQPGVGSYVDIGLDRMAFVPQAVGVNTRVTLAVGELPQVQFMPDFGENMILGQVSHLEAVSCISYCPSSIARTSSILVCHIFMVFQASQQGRPWGGWAVRSLPAVLWDCA